MDIQLPTEYVLCRHNVKNINTGSKINRDNIKGFFDMFAYFSRRDIFRKDEMVLDIIKFIVRDVTLVRDEKGYPL